MPDVKPLARYVSGDRSEIKAYQKKLQRYSSSRGEMTPDIVMTTKSLYGQHYMMNEKLIGCNRVLLNP